MQVQSGLDYCAGVVDVAGSIRGQQMKRANRPNDTYRMVVSVIADNPDSLEILAKVFGGRIKRETKGRTVPVYRWTLTNRESLARFASRMKGRLRSLEPQLEILDEFLKVTRPIHGPRGDTPEEMKLRKTLYLKLLWANEWRRDPTRRREEAEGAPV